MTHPSIAGRRRDEESCYCRELPGFETGGVVDQLHHSGPRAGMKRNMADDLPALLGDPGLQGVVRNYEVSETPGQIGGVIVVTVDDLGKTLDGMQIVFYPRSNTHAISLPKRPRSSGYAVLPGMTARARAVTISPTTSGQLGPGLAPLLWTPRFG
jgi:hypothetical protein